MVTKISQGNYCDFLTPTDAVTQKSTQIYCRQKILLTQPVGIVLKCATDAGHFYTALVMVSIGAR